MRMAEFVLNPRFEAGCFEIVRRSSCRILLKNEANFPWIIIVPEVSEEIEELHELSEEMFDKVTAVIRSASAFVDRHFSPDKINVGCIGNKLRQLHIHVVGRFENDPAWPGVVWAFDGKKKYDDVLANEIIAAAERHFAECL